MNKNKEKNKDMSLDLQINLKGKVDYFKAKTFIF